MQLLAYALFFTTALNISASSRSVVVGHLELRHVSESGEVDIDAADVTQGQLDDLADELTDLGARIRNAAGVVPARSMWCGRCPSQANCPAWKALESHLSTAILQVGDRPLARPPETEEEARLLDQAIGATEFMLEVFKDRRIAWLDQHPEGLVVGAGLRRCLSTSEHRRAVDTAEAVAAVKALLGEGAIEYVPHVTIGRIVAAARASIDKGTMGRSELKAARDAAEREAVEALEKAGVIVSGGMRRTVVTTGE